MIRLKEFKTKIQMLGYSFNKGGGRWIGSKTVTVKQSLESEHDALGAREAKRLPSVPAYVGDFKNGGSQEKL